MQALLLFIQYYQNLILFLFLELICSLLIVYNNRYYNSLFNDSLNEYSSVVTSRSNNIWEYFNLKDINEELIEENARLNYMLTQRQRQLDKILLQSKNDTNINQVYDFIVSKVVNKSTYKAKNYITIDKGSDNDIEVGMGVITSSGLVGKIAKCSPHFSTVIPLLHTDISVSASVKRNQVIGSIKWEGRDTRYVKMLHVPSHLNIAVGDTILTSGYNAVFPPNILIGTVEKVGLKQDETFYDIDVKLSTNFDNLSYVYVIKNLLKTEQDSLELKTIEKFEGKKNIDE